LYNESNYKEFQIKKKIQKEDGKNKYNYCNLIKIDQVDFSREKLKFFFCLLNVFNKIIYCEEDKVHVINLDGILIQEDKYKIKNDPRKITEIYNKIITCPKLLK